MKSKKLVDSTLSQVLRKAIEASEMTKYRISQETGVEQSTLSRFINGSSMSLENAEKICSLLGLQLTKKE